GFVESANNSVDYARQAELAARSGLRVSTLVTRCLPEVLEAWEQIASRAPIRDLRWVLVHLHVATESQIERIRRLGAVATTNPISYLWRSGSAERARLGSQRDSLIPHRTLTRLGVPFGMATDNKPANPWLAFQAAVDRRDMTTGEVLGAGERLSRTQALRALTVGGAWVTFAERERGMLASGRAADLAVLDRDPLTVPSQELGETGARLTVGGGRGGAGGPEAGLLLAGRGVFTGIPLFLRLDRRWGPEPVRTRRSPLRAAGTPGGAAGRSRRWPPRRGQSRSSR